MSEKTKRYGLQVLTAFSPVVALVLFQFGMKGPASVEAGYMGDEMPMLPDISEVDLSLLTDFETEDYAALKSPFWFIEMRDHAPDMMGGLIGINHDEESSSDPKFSVTAVLPSATKSLAVINGEACGEGDEVVPGWTLLKISGKDRYVIIQHVSGRRMRVLMK